METIYSLIEIFANNAPAIVGGFIALSFAGYTAYNVAVKGQKAAAAATFRSAFSNIILNLKENPDLPSAQIANIDRYVILAAAQEYRLWVRWFSRRAFDKAVCNYKEACEIACEGGNIFALISSETTEYAAAKRAKLNNAVHNLYSFGKT